MTPEQQERAILILDLAASYAESGSIIPFRAARLHLGDMDTTAGGIAECAVSIVGARQDAQSIIESMRDASALVREAIPDTHAAVRPPE